MGFLHAIVGCFVAEHALDRTRAHVTGVSNGGGMTIRLALETPDFERAVVVASVPPPRAWECCRSVSPYRCRL
ncbi:MAG: hypothetical protein ABIS07_00270 [Dokdonella sp.]